MARFADVVLPVPLPGLFTYALPDDMQTHVQAGCRVVVPFGNKKTTTALVVRLHDTEPHDITLKEVISQVDAVPIVLDEQLSLWQWIADFYMCAIGEVYKAALPAPLKKGKKGAVAYEGVEPLPDEISFTPAPISSLGGGALSPAQQTALEAIHAVWHERPVCLLHGVTSSGKTEIYIHLIAEALRQGRQVLYLLPEIVLTTQLTDRLRAVFGERLGVYHSKYSDRQRIDVWRRQLTDEAYDIIVGVRSSVFLPFKRLGLVIVDEEHDTSFKQQDPAPRYNARNVAIMLATRLKAQCLLGTATPSLESYYNARMGKYGLVTLSERYGQVKLPQVEVIDIQEMRHKRLMEGQFSSRLLEVMSATLQEHRQVILFQNRRGFSPQIECHNCGWVPRCPHCDVALTLHKRLQRMTCHYCGYATAVPQVCPACEERELRQIGFGTERIEDDIHRHFPEARVARMDLDTTRTRNAYEGILHDFATGQTDILVGTQMVTKGLDFDNVSLVAILSADTMLNQPDFRAYEHAFQMMSQVAGRAGRRDKQGLVLLQARNAELPIIGQVVSNDYEAMYSEQMLERRQFAFPPFVRLIIMYIKHRSSTTADMLARDATMMLRQAFGTRVLGPDEPPVARVQSLFIRRILLKFELDIPLTAARQAMHDVRSRLLEQKDYASAHIYFDVDPM